jgi:hypothetical protein
MSTEHPVARIARLIYDRDDGVALMAQELGIPRLDLDELLAEETLPPDARLLLIGFAVKKAEYLRQRAYQLLNLSANI